MNLIVGLGNIGKKYKNNRHNIGFLTIDALLEEGGFVDVSKSIFLGNLYKKNNFLLLKAHTFMNSSGRSVLAVKSFYKPQKVIVIHDDLDLDFGALKFKLGGGHSGHNGLKSCDECVGKDYFRIRMGISKPKFKIQVASYVLEDFSVAEQPHLATWIAKAKTAALSLCNKSLQEISREFSQKRILV